MIRLPRDWLGPRDELIPFGPTADEEPSTTTTEDFWGEAPHWDLEPAPPAAPRPALFARAGARVSEHARLALATIVLAVCLTVIGLSAGTAPHPRPRTQARAGTRAALSAQQPLASHPATHLRTAASRRGPGRHRTPGRRPVMHHRSHHTRARAVTSVVQVAHYAAPATTTAATQDTPSPVTTNPSTSQPAASQASGNPSPAIGSGGQLAPGTSPDS